MLFSIFLTSVHIAWMIYWGRIYKSLRSQRKYAAGRTLVDTNTRYKFIGYATFFIHNFIAVACYWSNAEWLLKLFDQGLVKLGGVAVLAAGTILHAVAIKHLGENYSPCFDSHLPKRLITSGPYARIRHPDYLAKLVVSFGLFLMTSSAWALMLLLWLLAEVTRSIYIEEKQLKTAFPEYANYQQRTARLIPFLL